MKVTSESGLGLGSSDPKDDPADRVGRFERHRGRLAAHLACRFEVLMRAKRIEKRFGDRAGQIRKKGLSSEERGRFGSWSDSESPSRTRDPVQSHGGADRQEPARRLLGRPNVRAKLCSTFA
jgi:hypothetical protein